MRQGSNPEVTVNADAEGILRAPPPKRGDPIENGIPIEEAFPQAVEGLLSICRGEIEDLRPKPAPEDDEPEEPAPTPQPSTRAKRVAAEAPAEPLPDTKEAKPE